MSSTAIRPTGWSRALLYVIALIAGASMAELASPSPSVQTARRKAASAHPQTPQAVAATVTPLDAPPASEIAPPAATAIDEQPHTPPRSIEDALGAAYKQGLIITGTARHRLILFTFDDGPDPRTTPLLLDRLDEAGIKAVFFLVASRIALTKPIEREQALLAREIVRRGHLVGGHTIDHVQLPRLDDDDVKQQLSGAEQIFERALGARPWIFRPPFGAHSQRIDQLLAARGYTTVLWSLGGEDFQVHTAEEVYQTWLKGFDHGRPSDDDRGGIILLHDTHPWSVDAFQMIVAHLLARNCELLERHEELFDFVDDLDFFYTPRGSALADSEAPPADLSDAVLEQRQAKLRDRTAQRCKSMASAD